jgi:hypothetical protein
MTSRTPALIAAAITIAALSGCASAGNPAAAGQPSSAPASPSCKSQFNSWRTNGGGPKLIAVVNDLNAAVKDAHALGSAVADGAGYSRPESALQSEVADLQADSQTSQDDPAPACVPGLAADQSAALNYASKAAIDSDNAIQALNEDDSSVLLADAAASSKAARAADAKFSAITADLNAFENGGNG